MSETQLVSELSPDPTPTEGKPRPKIAIFDYATVRGNPVGGCHLRLLESLHQDYDFTVFSHSFENPAPGRIEWVKVPVPSRPLALLFLSYHVLAPIVYRSYCRRKRVQFDLVQMVESNLLFGDISYSQFCHRQYLDVNRGSFAFSPRGLASWLDHKLHTLTEPWVYRHTRRIVAASAGLFRELSGMYDGTRGKITTIPNPVDIERMQAPADFDRLQFRAAHGLSEDDLVLSFAALGHFERKGLPLILEALARVRDPHLKLVVVGGTPGIVTRYRRRVVEMGLSERVFFAGTQRDFRDYLWAADLFILPSAYEVFPLVALEAAAAGLALIATPMNGVEEFLRDGYNGFLVERNSIRIAAALADIVQMPRSVLRQMGRRAQTDVRRYSTQTFIENWQAFYAAAVGRAKLA